jgi:hypothetical protein
MSGGFEVEWNFLHGIASNEVLMASSQGDRHEDFDADMDGVDGDVDRDDERVGWA